MKPAFWYLPLCLLWTLSVHAQRHISKDNQLNNLDKLLQQVVTDQHVAGMAVAVVKGNQVIYSKGFGYRDLEHHKPVTSNTIFAIGSTTKAFTDALLGMLEKEGRLSLDGKVRSYLPELQFINNEMNDGLTVRDLMVHRTGLARFDPSWYFFNSSSRDSLLRRIKYMEPIAGIREKWLYNNFMYMVLGRIPEKLTGKSWEQNIKERFFAPLGMTRSGTSIAELEKDADHALGYTLENDTTIKQIPYFHMKGMAPAGSLTSSVNEMTSWLKLWIGKGHFNGKEILPPGYVAQATDVQMAMGNGWPGYDKDIYLSGYGLGWMISSYRGHYLVEHGGNVDGFTTNVAFYPTDSLGIVTVVNQDNSSVPDLVRNVISDRVLQLEPVDWNGRKNEITQEVIRRRKAEKPEPDANYVAGTKPSHPLKDYVGLYTNPAFGTIEVYRKNDSLFVQMGRIRAWLRHYHYDVFSTQEVEKDGHIDPVPGTFRISFISGSDGKMASLNGPFNPDSGPVTFSYHENPAQQDKDVPGKLTSQETFPPVKQ